MFIGKQAAMAVFSLLLLGLLIHHLRHMVKVVTWAQAALGTPVPHSSGVWDYIFATLSRRARTALEQRETLARNLARFREASQAMPDGVMYLSHQHSIEWMNAAAADFFALDSEKDLGRPVTTLIREPDFVNFMRQEPTPTGSTEPLMLRSLRRGGLSLAIQRIPFGEDLEMLLARDVTQLERLDSMRRDFVANVSHELNTPLTVVNGFIETLLDAGDDINIKDRQRFLELSLEQSHRMQSLVEDLLSLSALQTGTLPAHEERVSVQSLLQKVLMEVRALSNNRHAIALDAAEAHCFLLGNPKELHSAFMNLASNAVRYTPEGGKIDLCWRLNSHGGATFSVKDTGIGIAAEHIGRLTERFYRVDSGRSRENGGTGLGLAIVKHVLTRHQAQLEITSEPGSGSCFSVHFGPKRVIHPEKN